MPQCREPTPNLPSIMSSGLGRYRLRNDMPYSSSSAISIPGVETQDDVVPPPLPPPRHLPFLEQPEQSNRKTREPNHSCSSFTTDYGSVRFPAEEKAEFKRRDTISGNHADEGYASYTASER